MEQWKNFKEILDRKTAETEAIVLSFLPEEKGFAAELAGAMNYSMRAGGKRLRPLMMRETYRMFGGTGTVVHPFMAAMEMIHTHSLIHDDLPAIDNDEYRRGRKTTHAVYGEAMGVLAGDALLNCAYETALLAFDAEGAVCERVIRALRILSRRTGLYGMLGGQSVDVANEKRRMAAADQSMLDYIYENKTSALIEASMTVGAVLGGAGPEEAAALERAASAIGLAFQIRDDILDVTSTQEELGKPILSDEKNEKTTYVTLFGVEGASAQAERLTGEAVSLLGTLPAGESRAFLVRLARELAFRKK